VRKVLGVMEIEAIEIDGFGFWMEFVKTLHGCGMDILNRSAYCGGNSPFHA
jgi:hypothetical protein